MDIATRLDFDNCDDDENDIYCSLSGGCDFANFSTDEIVDLHNDTHTLNNNTIATSSPRRLFSPRKSRPICSNSTVHFTSNNYDHEDAYESPPCKKICALKLFDSPATPKTLLEKSVPVENETPSSNRHFSVTRSGTRSRLLFNNRRNNLLLNESIIEEDSNVGGFEPGFVGITPPSSVIPNGQDQSQSSSRQSANINPFTPTGMLLSSRKRTRSNREIGLEHNPMNTSTEPMNTSSGSHNTTIDLCIEDEDQDLCLDMGEDDGEVPPMKRLTMREANVSRYNQEFIELELIGRGDFGRVYRVRHRLDGCVYAVKKSLKPVAGSANERKAFNEVYAHAVLGKHHHVVRYYSAWAEDNHMIIQNEYCNCGSLADMIVKTQKHNRPISEQRLKHVIFHISKGLRYIHSLNLVHMDIKPGNIFISREQKVNHPGDDSADDGFEEEQEEEEEITYKIGDLGHVTSIHNSLAEEGDCRYLPKEIIAEDYSHLAKADIFALGLSIFEAAQGKPLPLNGDEWHYLRNGNLEPLPAYSSEFHSLICQMIHPDPSMRPTAAQLVNHPFLCPAIKSSNAQLRLELHNEKLKNEMLTRKLEEAERIRSINLASLQSTARTRAQRAANCSTSRETRATRNNSTRLVGRKMNRSMSIF